MHRRAVMVALVLVAIAAASACGKKASPSRLVFLRKVDGQTRLFEAVPERGEPREVLADLPGELSSPRAIEGGRALLLLARPAGATTGELWRARVGSAALEKDVILARDVPGRILAASDDGSAVLLSDGEQVWVLRLGNAATAPSPEFIERFRYVGADISPDGNRGVIAGIARSCPAESPGGCPIDLWTVDLGASPPTLRPLLMGGDRANYSPVFVPGTQGAQVGYMTTDGDASAACTAHTNNCRHDLMRISFTGGEPTLIRRGPALGPYYGPDGHHVAYLVFDEHETGCRSVVCDTMSVHTVTVPAQGEGVERRLVTANASNRGRPLWSADGRWLAYIGRDGATIEVVRADGSARRTIGEGTDRAWLK